MYRKPTFQRKYLHDYLHLRMELQFNYHANENVKKEVTVAKS
jgi:hypothetical protein